MVQGLYLGLDAATLQTMLTEALATRTAILKAHQSYSGSNRSIQRADFKAVTADIQEISFALNIANGTLNQIGHADMSHGA